MATIDWPAAFPRLPLQEGFSVTPVSNLYYNQTDTGPGKTRRKQSAVVKDLSFQIRFIDRAQLNDFWAFYEETTYSGALKFNWPELAQYFSNKAHEYQLDPQGPFTETAQSQYFIGQIKLKAWPIPS